MNPVTLAQMTDLAKTAVDLTTALALVVGGAWAYRKFHSFERRWLDTESQPSLEPRVSARALPGPNPQEAVLALRSSIWNRGRVNATVNMDGSWFVLDQAEHMVLKEGVPQVGPDGQQYVTQDSLLDVAVVRLRVTMGSPGLAVVRARASLSCSNICIVPKGVYRVTAQYAVSSQDLRYFSKLTGSNRRLDEVAWVASTIVDARG
jgi:hypothetical protein